MKKCLNFPLNRQIYTEREGLVIAHLSRNLTALILVILDQVVSQFYFNKNFLVVSYAKNKAALEGKILKKKIKL